MMTENVSNLYFHNFRHTWDVYEQVKLLALSENIGEEDTLLMKTAALLHDIGYSFSYNVDMTALSEDFAREILPIFQYKPQQIDRICRLMKATHYESTPNGVLEEIMHDANLMYFGQADYITRMMSLAREQEKHDFPVNKTVWLQYQINRQNHHQFYTRAAREQVKASADQQIFDAEVISN
jgi:HD superfamily phosphodiesterase